MRSVPVRYREQVISVPCGPEQSLEEFREAVYAATGVPVERQKLVGKRGLLKDMALLSGTACPPTLLLIGPPGTASLVRPPDTMPIFVEDMPAETPVSDPRRTGLANLGHTCYLNSTLQVWRSISELRLSLEQAVLSDDSEACQMAKRLRNLYRDMDRSTEAVVAPSDFLSALRSFAPQFAERASEAQDSEYLPQDSSEVWSMAMEAFESTLPALIGGQASPPITAKNNFVTQYMGGLITVARTCPQAPEEPASEYQEPFTLLSCPITGETDDLVQGLLSGFGQEIQKHSPTLGRTVPYEERSRISRLPQYLAIHLARFYWRRDVGQKTKILRKVHFPLELDAWSLLTDELRRRTRPAANTMRKIEWDRRERSLNQARARERQHRRDLALRTWDDERDGRVPSVEEWEEGGLSNGAGIEGLTHQEEKMLREQEQETFRTSIDPDIAADLGANPTGLYELVGLVTHKGPATENGHYMSWVKQPPSTAMQDSPAHMGKTSTPTWYRFADEEVEEFTQEDVIDLKGGTAGNSLAYILLYRSKVLE